MTVPLEQVSRKYSTRNRRKRLLDTAGPIEFTHLMSLKSKLLSGMEMGLQAWERKGGERGMEWEKKERRKRELRNGEKGERRRCNKKRHSLSIPGRFIETILYILGSASDIAYSWFCLGSLQSKVPVVLFFGNPWYTDISCCVWSCIYYLGQEQVITLDRHFVMCDYEVSS